MGGLALTSLALPRFGSAVLFPRPSYRQPKTHVRKPSENLDLTRIWRILEQSYWRTLASQLLLDGIAIGDARIIARDDKTDVALVVVIYPLSENVGR
jgi:hypothetical protein